MATSKLFSRYYISLKISLIYLFISSSYIIFSDHVITSIFEKTLSIEFLTTVQTYKGLGFVFITSVLLFALIQREVKAKIKSIRELELQKDYLSNLADENDRVKKRLHERNIFIETILKNLPIGLAVNKIDDGKAIFMNKKFSEIYGWPEKYLDTQDSFFEHVYPERKYRDSIKTKVLEEIKSGDLKKMQWEGIEITTKNGERRFINAQNIPVHEQNLMISTVQNVTKQKKTEKRIIESEKKYRLLAENTTDVISLLDKEGRFVYVSPSIKNVSGYEPDELLGKKSCTFFHPKDTQLVVADSYWNRLKSGLSISLNYRFISKDGEYEWMESKRQPVFNNKNELVKIVSTSRTITERIEREQEIENYHKTLKKLTTEISLVEEKQRKEIAVNIHDHLSQLLVVSKMKLTDILSEISNSNTQTELKTVVNYISEALENTRKITFDLSPPILYELGLIETMHWLVEKIQNEHPIETVFITSLEELELSESNLILIFRIIQELVNNTVKHARADFLKIKIDVTDNLLQIDVADDGVGFNVNALPKAKIGKGGFGLFTIRERVQNLDGNISIYSEKGKGTQVEIFVPLEI
ncbi:PAS domain S-box protein [Draconibacterium halophilum]|uniref:Oxygen sensor histidine kinase NreB n=1 Tax=Draconibacterium halophilum TaxID=2706887 RepID=A0A6C0RJJ1_9BACT|nr:PAS domain S-box protein [Draconibacterium halophilum]QIA09341.1 PAS domain S-box protein [Draconibacterium halophilum]